MTLNTKIRDGLERLRRLHNIILKHPRLVKIHDKIAWLLKAIGAGPADVPARVEAATLTNAGIRFKNMRFHDETVTGPLLDDLMRGAKRRFRPSIENVPARIKVVIKFNPADAGSIAVWNPAAKHYVTLPNLEPQFCDGLSFWHVERLREHAKRQHLDFSSEADRLKAHNALREFWEKLTIGKD